MSEANNGGDNVRLIWPDTDGYETLDTGKEYVLTSVLKEMSTSVEDVVTQASTATSTTACTWAPWRTVAWALLRTTISRIP